MLVSRQIISAQFMEKLSTEEVNHIAKLSKLELTQEEIEKYSSQLSSVLEYVSQLDEVSTENVEPTANITGLENILRQDAVWESPIDHTKIAMNAPKFEKSSFVVPGVFE